MAKRIVRRGGTQRQAVRALEDACDLIEDAHAEAKDTYRDAVASADPAAIAQAKARKVETANQLNETRTWLRREAAIVKLATSTIPELERRLAGPILIKDGHDAREDVEERARLQEALDRARDELALLGEEAAVTRRQLEELGGQVAGDPVPPDLPPGSAHVGMPPLATKATVNSRPKGGK